MFFHARGACQGGIGCPDAAAGVFACMYVYTYVCECAFMQRELVKAGYAAAGMCMCVCMYVCMYHVYVCECAFMQRELVKAGYAAAGMCMCVCMYVNYVCV